MYGLMLNVKIWNQNSIHCISNSDPTSHVECGIIIDLERGDKRTTQRKYPEFIVNVLCLLEELDSSDPSKCWQIWKSLQNSMMTSSNGNIFPRMVTGEFPSLRLVTRGFDGFFFICGWINGWVHSHEAGDLRCHCAHYEAIVMGCLKAIPLIGPILLSTYIPKWNEQMQLNRIEACGADGIKSECLHYAADSLELPVTAFFNYVFNTGGYPNEWGWGVGVGLGVGVGWGWGVGINPIHKKGAIKQPHNYCKITLLYALSKLVDTVLNTWYP